MDSQSFTNLTSIMFTFLKVYVLSFRSSRQIERAPFSKNWCSYVFEMWVASPYLMAGFVAVANARAIPYGYLNKREFQSSSSSTSYSSGSETTSDGRVSRTTVYGGTPYTITQNSRSSPVMGQGTSVSTLQIGQNPPQIIPDSFPRVSMPFPTTPFASPPLLPIGIPTPTSTFTQALPVVPQNFITGQSLNAPQTIAQSALNPIGQVLSAPTQAATTHLTPAPVASTVRTPTTPPQATASQNSKVIDPPVATSNSQNVPSQASRVSPQAQSASQAQAPILPQSASTLSGPSPSSSGPTQDSKPASNVLFQTARTQPPPALENQAPAAKEAFSVNSTSSPTPPPTTSLPTPNSSPRPTKALIFENNSEEKVNEPARPAKAVVPDTNVAEKADQTSRVPTQPQEATFRLPEPVSPVSQASGNGAGVPPVNPTKLLPSLAAQNPTPQGNTTNRGSPRNFPVVGLPVGPHAQELVSTKPVAENAIPDRPPSPPQSRNPVAQNQNPVAQNASPVAQNQNAAGQNPNLVGQNPIPVAQNPISVAQNPIPVAQNPIPVAQNPIPIAQNENLVAQNQNNGIGTSLEKSPNNLPLPIPAPAAGATNALPNPTRVETGTIPVLIEALTPEGRPFRSDGILKISNLVPVTSPPTARKESR
ncbi:hypothetical protein PCASD_04047 [Puccinia coronata f. sp. avenae]|uniref:Uncharacterized protein n=1 Tax=Puccinia coronata f. sp. avenae TaxID=200324 RepID=A0A2N5VCJ4_9BASI|nr:hypothetical protein PCASD_04047 [Puccinia coronata f. sp. avenae]